jgi:hypothetical protein
MGMKKSEMVREAGEASEAHRKAERVCYCTPSRQMMMSVEKVCMNEGMPEVVEEMSERIAVQLRVLTDRVRHNEPLRTFDTMDTSAAYAIWNEPGFNEEHAGSIVRQAFEQAAVTYEAEEIAAWDAAKAAWEESVRSAAKTSVRRKVAPPLDPAAQRGKTAKVAQESTIKHEA